MIISAQNICTAADALGLGLGLHRHRHRVLSRPCARSSGASRRGLPGRPALPRISPYPAASAQKLDPTLLVHHEVYRDPRDQELREGFERKYEGLRVEATPERIETLKEVCRTVSGESLAREAEERVRELGYIHPVQRYFGLHYRADTMCDGNEAYQKILQESGIDIFRPRPGTALAQD